jgi:osmotically-inducible protein OsmY
MYALRFKSSPQKNHLVSFNLEIINMNIFKKIMSLFAAISMMFALGCASTSKQEGTGEYIDDTVITTRVKAAILAEPGLKSVEINVETFKGIVQLSGFVTSADNVSKAAEVARGISGVKSVKNDMRVR